MKQYRVTNPWRVIVIYPNRRTEVEEFNQFNEIVRLSRVRRIYLDELAKDSTQTLGVAVLRLIIEGEATAIAQAQSLVERAREELIDEATQKNLIDLITTIIIYKLPHKQREEIEAMFTLGDLKKTKVYQEAVEEGEQRGEQRGEQKAKLEAIPELLKEGLTIEQIARVLKLSLEIVQEIAQKQWNYGFSLFLENPNPLSAARLESQPQSERLDGYDISNGHDTAVGQGC